MITLMGVSFISGGIAILLWRRQKKLEFATVLDRRLLAISARAQNDHPNFESYR